MPLPCKEVHAGSNPVVSSMNLTCNLCGFVAVSLHQLAGHRSAHVRRGELPKRIRVAEHKCSICQKTFESGTALGGHQNGHKPFDELKSSDARCRRIIEEIGRRCECCQNTTWMREPIPLDLDHIDGNPDNDTRENLRLLCPNCHRLTPTWGAKNKIFPNSQRSKVMKQRRAHSSAAEYYPDVIGIGGSNPPGRTMPS